MIFYIFFIFKSSAAVICVMTPTSTGEHYNFTVEAGLLRGTSRKFTEYEVVEFTHRVLFRAQHLIFTFHYGKVANACLPFGFLCRSVCSLDDELI